MQQITANKHQQTFKERMGEISQLRYLLLIEGMSQVQAAKQLGRAPKTVCQWVKRYGIRDEIHKLKGSQQNARSLKLDNSLPVFTAWLRIHHKDLFKQLQPVLKKFSQPN